jgi:hypothetical protein
MYKFHIVRTVSQRSFSYFYETGEEISSSGK